MKRALSILIVSGLVLSSCGAVRDSRMNPFNWFGRASSARVVQADDVNPLIPRRRSVFEKKAAGPYAGQLIAEIFELRVDRRPGGAVIKATGVSTRMGVFDVRLVKNDEDSTNGVLAYDMKRLQGPGPAGGNDFARSVTAAVTLSDNELAGIRTIRVRGARNVMTSRR